ncbi:MAG: hypothetical protein OXN97_17840 [Bryobacterales bacterium]|nr:hypothetical protein [Bryobacterales bacterium]
MKKHVLPVAAAIALCLWAAITPANAAERYEAVVNAVACDDKPAMIEFVRALNSGQDSRALSIANRARSSGASCTVVKQGTFVAGAPSGWGLIYLPGGGYYSPMAGFDPAPRLAMRGGWKCNEQSEFEKSQGMRQASNVSQRLILTRSRERFILAFMIPDGGVWLLEHSPREVKFTVDGGGTHTIETQYGNLEAVLTNELTTALKRGLNVWIEIVPDSGRTYSYSASLIGFTAAHACVSLPI